VLGSLAELQLQQGQLAQAEESLVQAEALLRPGETWKALAQVLCTRAELLQAQGRSQEGPWTEAVSLARRGEAGPQSPLQARLAALQPRLPHS
jgi:ATP/maltotriose-dependent transcriptional regulator MalT